MGRVDKTELFFESLVTLRQNLESGQTPIDELTRDLARKFRSVVRRTGLIHWMGIVTGPDELGRETFDIYLNENQETSHSRSRRPTMDNVVDAYGYLAIAQRGRRVLAHLFPVPANEIPLSEIEERVLAIAERSGRTLAFSEMIST